VPSVGSIIARSIAPAMSELIISGKRPAYLSSRNDFRVGHRLAVGDAATWRPYPLLAKSGEQGSAKTVLSKMLKALVDPITALVRAAKGTRADDCRKQRLSAGIR
jgi:hypothetical protein